MAEVNPTTNIVKRKIGDEGEYSNFYTAVKDKFNLAIPETISTFDPTKRFSFTYITVDNKTPLGKGSKNQDLYIIDNTITFKKRVFLQLLMAGDVKYKSRQVERQTDKDGRVTYINHVVDFEKVEIDGKVNSGSANGKYDYFADKDSNKTALQVSRRRSNADQLAETNALKRAAEHVFPMLRTNFSELKEVPAQILVASVVQDLSNLLEKYPDLEREYLAKQLNVADHFYKNPPQLENEGPKVKRLSDSAVQKGEENAEQIKEQSRENKNETPNAEEASYSDISDPTPEELNKITAGEYRDQSQEVRTKKINELVKETGFKRKGNAPIADMAVDKQIEVIEMLLNLKDQQAGGSEF